RHGGRADAHDGPASGTGHDRRDRVGLGNPGKVRTMSTVPASVPAGVPPIPEAQDRPWYIVGRWQEYRGEERANLLRLAAVAAFYIIELINYYGVNLGFIQLPKVSDLAFHQTVTAVAVAWVMLGLGVHLWLRLHILPA